MPKRSNDFQRFIAILERLAASPTARVVESSELAEYPKSSPRELDILVEDTVSGHPIRIAVECRDYKRKQDKTWIDTLVGKYRDLQIDKVVAVSSSGFTKGAIEKAAAVGISALTLRAAIEADWKSVFIKKPFIAFHGHVASLTGARLQFAAGQAPLPPGTDFSGWVIVDFDGKNSNTVRETARSLYSANYRAIVDEHVARNKLIDPTAPRDVPFDFYSPFRAHERFLRAPDGTLRQIATFWIKIAGTTRSWDATHRHIAYERNIATVGTVTTDGETHEITVVQIPGEPRKVLPFAYRRMRSGSPGTSRAPAKSRFRGRKKNRRCAT